MKRNICLFVFTLLALTRALATPTPVSVWNAEGNGNDAMGINNGSLNAVAFAAGKSGQAFSFNGYTSYVIVADSATLDRPHVTNAFTFCAWIKWDGVPKSDFCPIFRKASGYGVTSYPWMTYDFLVGNSGKPGVSISDGSPSGQIVGVESASAITVGVWHFIAATYNGTSLNIYVDGMLKGSTATTLQIGDRDGPLYIGATTTYANNNNFGGLIDDVAIYDQALSALEIQVRGGFNLAPQANAGPDQIVYAGTNAEGAVTLDGSGSTDSEGDPLTYTWSGSSVNATGVSPTISLPVGIHMITLSVTDGYNQPTTSIVHIAVVSGVGAAGYTQMQTLLQSLTAQAQIDANTIDTLTLKNAALNNLLQSLLSAFDQIKAAAATINSISDDKKQAINAALSGN